MPFDIKTARPIEEVEKKGFDITTARPIEEETPEETTGSSAKSLLTAFGIGAGGVYGAQKALEATAPARTNIAGNLMNSIIKPAHKQYMFGKNPGKGMAQEGIWGMSIEGLGNKVEQRLSQLNEYSKQIRSLSENQAKTVNLESMFEPLKNLSKEFSKAKLTNKAHLNKISNLVKDLRSNIPKELNIREMPLEAAYGLKKVVEGLQKWDVQSSADDMMNRVEVLSKQSPEKLLNLVNSIPNIVSNTATKSGLAKILSEKFGMITKGSVRGLMTVAPIIDAMKYAQDPEGYLYQLERGQELPPKGSLEREYELGR